MALLRNFLVLSLVLGGAACGDDDGGSDNADAAPSADASDVDAGGGADVSGTVLLLEGAIQGVPEAGSGNFLFITFTPNADRLAPSYEQQPGSPFACKVYERTPAQYAYGGVDEGEVQITTEGGAEFPPCVYVEAEGAYRCISVAGGGGDIEAAGGPTFSITNDALDFGADEAGRHVQVSGAATATNNGMFPIVAADDTSITFVNPAGAEELDTAATYRIVAGFGPAGVEDPMADDASATISLTSGGEGDLADFEYTAADVGDSFTLDTASQDLISNIPTDGETFTLSCGGAGGDCGTSIASGIQIITTDGSIEGLPPGAFPDPETKSVLVDCIFLQPDVVIPAEASAFLESAGATMIRTIYVRVNPAMVGTTAFPTGHAVAGITIPE